MANYTEQMAGNPQFPFPADCVFTSLDEWQRRRETVRETFARIMYGYIPPKAECVRYELRREKEGIFGGIAIRREIRIHLEHAGKTHFADVLWYLPVSEKPVPAIVGLNFMGNHACSGEDDVFISEMGRYPDDMYGKRGQEIDRWSFEKLLKAGFSVVTSPRNDFFPDHADGRSESIFKLFHPQESLTRENREFTAISAWAWGYILMLELLLNESRIDPGRIWAHGHSRLGKTALWAVVNESRFAGVVSNDSGCCGAATCRRDFGETLEAITRNFPWWFQKELDSYCGREAELPFDQHLLLGLVAPRPLLVSSAVDDLWADPRGEFLSLRAADDFFRLFGKGGIGKAEFPLPEQPLFADGIGYYRRRGVHDVTPVDWEFVLQFINKNS